MSVTIRQFRILGSGSSGGVPRVGGNWGDCDPAEPKNRRSRCSLLVTQEGEEGRTAVLIDTSPDLRNQLLDAEIDWIDGVIYTHAHADQAHGIDDLRACAINRFRRVDIHADQETLDVLTTRFDYCFEGKTGYPAILNAHLVDGPVTIDGPGGAITATSFEVDHGTCTSYGWRIGDMAYIPDVVAIDDETLASHMAGLDILIIDALRYTPHPTHSHVEQTLGWIAACQPKHAILTNLHVDLDYQKLKSELPDGVEPAYDGLTLRF